MKCKGCGMFFLDGRAAGRVVVFAGEDYHSHCALIAENDALKAKLADSEREREALQKAHDLLNAGFESATEQMHELKQTVRSLEAKLTDSEAARLKAACVAMRQAIKSAINNAPGGTLAELNDRGFSTVEIRSTDWHKLIEATSTDAGQHVIDFIAAARRLREKLNTSLMLVDHAGEIALAIADVDAAAAKLTGGTA